MAIRLQRVEQCNLELLIVGDEREAALMMLMMLLLCH